MIPQCKVHGLGADVGAAACLEALQRAGYRGPVATQVPLYSERGRAQSRALPSKNRSAKSARKQAGGVFHRGATMKVDLVLASRGSEFKLAAVEVQGTSHLEARNMHKDKIKCSAVHACGMQLFEMQAWPATVCPRPTKCGRHAPRLDAMQLSYNDSVAHEVVTHLS